MRAALCMAIGLALVATGCKQIFGLDSPNQLDSGGPIATIGFGMPTTLADEASGILSIPVLLTEPADGEVAVSFRILGGTATENEDYVVEQKAIVIPVGSQVGTLDIEIVADQVLEDDETIELALAMPRGATLGLAEHTVTINATVLPRVNFVATMSSTAEASTRQSIMVVLDTPSTFPINVMLGTSGTATSPTDFELVANPVAFAPGTTSQVVQVDVKHDLLDEDDETAIVTLLGADAAIVGTMPEHTLTISDNDNPPTVSLAPPSTSVPENVGTAMITVQLNTPSGKDITVPFTGGGTAAVTTDYTYATPSPLTIPAGSMSASITINVVDNAADGPNKTLTTTLGTPMNAQLGSPSAHTLTITDDEVVCVGPSGNAFEVCYDTAPTATAALPATVDTNVGVLCQATLPIGWTAAGQPDACVIWASSVTATTTVVTGSRPLVIAATGTITITTGLDASSQRNPARVGPGAPFGGCGAFPDAPDGSPAGAGGGAGGSFMTKGGNGGPGAVNGGLSPDPDAAQPAVLRAGCTGQRGGVGDASPGGPAGVGGGAVYLVAGTSITVQSGAYINASGASGNVIISGGGPDDAGGSGGGTGGMIRLHAPTLLVNGAAIIANGGGGGEGNTETDVGAPGSDPNVTTPLQPAPGGAAVLGAGNGGSGFAGTTAATSGLTGSNGGGGGGGGGGGLIRSNVALTGATTSAGAVVVAP